MKHRPLFPYTVFSIYCLQEYIFEQEYYFVDGFLGSKADKTVRILERGNRPLSCWEPEAAWQALLSLNG
jgi:hypothetical protein